MNQGPDMPIDRQKLAPVVFWIGFLALGFISQLAPPHPHKESRSIVVLSEGPAEKTK
jgi:hypothetical protein